MKTKIIVYVLLAAIAVLGFYGYFRATPRMESGGKNRPRIEIEPASGWDFGEVKYGEKLEHTFRLKNSGEKILKVKKVATSCACTTASVAKEQISPGEETELKVVYDTGAMSGPTGRGKQERIIYIKSNDPLNPQVEVEIYAMVR